MKSRILRQFTVLAQIVFVCLLVHDAHCLNVEWIIKASAKETYEHQIPRSAQCDCPSTAWSEFLYTQEVVSEDFQIAFAQEVKVSYRNLLDAGGIEDVKFTDSTPSCLDVDRGQGPGEESSVHLGPGSYHLYIWVKRKPWHQPKVRAEVKYKSREIYSYDRTSSATGVVSINYGDRCIIDFTIEFAKTELYDIRKGFSNLEIVPPDCGRDFDYHPDVISRYGAREKLDHFWG